MGENYKINEGLYNFNVISFLTKIVEISKFEKNNADISINMYALKLKNQNNIVSALKNVKDEKNYYFDFLILHDNNNSHYVFINNFSHITRSQLTVHHDGLVFCKSHFTLFDNRPTINKLRGQEDLD